MKFLLNYDTEHYVDVYSVRDYKIILSLISYSLPQWHSAWGVGFKSWVETNVYMIYKYLFRSYVSIQEKVCIKYSIS